MQFKVKLNLIKNNSNIKLLSKLKSIINAPVIKNNEVVGVILDYNLETDEAIGYLFNTYAINFCQDDTIANIEIMEK